MTRHSHDNGEWEMIERSDDHVSDIVEALEKIGASYISYAQVAAALKAEYEGAGRQAEARPASERSIILILQTYTETLRSGACIGWYLTVGQTNWGTTAYWNVGILRGKGWAIQTASVHNPDYVLAMLRAAAGLR